MNKKQIAGLVAACMAGSVLSWYAISAYEQHSLEHNYLRQFIQNAIAQQQQRPIVPEPTTSTEPTESTEP